MILLVTSHIERSQARRQAEACRTLMSQVYCCRLNGFCGVSKAKSMERSLKIILISTLYVFSQNAPVAQTPSPTKFKGFLGTYHPFKGTAYGGPGWKDGELMQHAFSFGQNAISRKPVTTAILLKKTSITVAATGMSTTSTAFCVLRRSKAQSISQKIRTYSSLMKELPGMIQGAHRFSELAKRCPQIAGVIIDDFFNDFPSKLSGENLRNIKDALLGKHD